ncbi:MAG: hypothetical protein HY670_07280 [Chloroflexi bacterium]|nr:hypothetical protein [Chloroflexota bacterium]
MAQNDSERAELLHKLERTPQIRISRRLMRILREPKAFEEHTERRRDAMTEDPREQTEKEVHYKIPEFIWNVLCNLDGKHIPMGEFKIRCYDRGLSSKGTKKALIWTLIDDEIEREPENQYILAKEAAEELDGLNIPLQKLKEKCKERGLSTGNRDKKELALDLLRYEFSHKVPI